jgi:hypothetical protein
MIISTGICFETLDASRMAWVLIVLLSEDHNELEARVEGGPMLALDQRGVQDHSDVEYPQYRPASCGRGAGPLVDIRAVRTLSEIESVPDDDRLVCEFDIGVVGASSEIDSFPDDDCLVFEFDILVVGCSLNILMGIK